jgi:molybdenum cofactor synthesis domain-containing protein
MPKKLITFCEAEQVIKSNFRAKPLGSEDIDLLDASGRVLAEDIKADMDVPPFDRSTVDGYAVLAKNTFEAEENRFVALKVCGTVSIGQIPHVRVGPHEAAEIVTGAPIPHGANAVVMIEDTERHADTVRVYTPVSEGENIMEKGSDIRKGLTVLRKRRYLGASEIGVLASLGFAKVKVFVQPVVAVLSTGGEIIEPGKVLLPARVYDINAYSLSSAVLESGGKPLYLGVIPDSRNDLYAVLKRALTLANVIVTSGGVSVGPKDVVPQTVASLGEPGILFSGIAIKPGKPVTVAIIEGKLVFCFPGHPTSALLAFHLLARPVITALAGREFLSDPTIQATASTRMFPAKGRRTFFMVRLERKEDSSWAATPVETGQSGAITTLAEADGFVEIAENQQFVDSGEEVIVQLLRDVAGRINQRSID